MMQGLNESTNEWISESTSQWINALRTQWVNESMKQWITSNETMKQCFNDSVSQWISKSTKSLNERCNQWIDEWRNLANLSFQKCSNPSSFFAIFMWNQALATVSCAFCQLHRPTVIRSTQFFAIFQCKANSTLKCACCSRYSLVHISPTSSFKSVPVPIPSVLFFYIFFYNFYVKLSSQKSPLHILPTLSSNIFQKCSGRLSF